MGGIPALWSGEVVTQKKGDPNAVVPGLMAIGEAACVSVHGANRLGSTSLLALVVFGRSAARRCAETLTPGEQARPPSGYPRDAVLDRFAHPSPADGRAPTCPLRRGRHHRP